MNPLIELDNVTVAYGKMMALLNTSLAVKTSTTCAIFGPSGCGKSTLLKLVAGILAPHSGEVLFRGNSLTGVPAHARGFPLVFQDALLFPHLTVLENVGFGLKLKGMSRMERNARSLKILKSVGMEEFVHRSPQGLSGGQRQRVSLARAYVLEPQVLLLDEPFSALDEWLKAELRDVLRELQRHAGTTTLLVSHDLRDVLELADDVLVLDEGKSLQVGSPLVLLRSPSSPKVARIFARHNILRLPNGMQISCAPQLGSLAPPQEEFLALGGIVSAVFSGLNSIEIVFCAEGGETARVCLNELAPVPQKGNSITVYWKRSDVLTYTSNCRTLQ